MYIRFSISSVSIRKRSKSPSLSASKTEICKLKAPYFSGSNCHPSASSALTCTGINLYHLLERFSSSLLFRECFQMKDFVFLFIDFCFLRFTCTLLVIVRVVLLCFCICSATEESGAWSERFWLVITILLYSTPAKFQISLLLLLRRLFFSRAQMVFKASGVVWINLIFSRALQTLQEALKMENSFSLDVKNRKLSSFSSAHPTIKRARDKINTRNFNVDPWRFCYESIANVHMKFETRKMFPSSNTKKKVYECWQRWMNGWEG